jgi:hypothetical protein|tara:strand:+ start:1215 stop:2762 length:1548 start_codon:yes stop_codon:yes gene_type:complete
MPSRPKSTVEETAWLSGGLNSNDPAHMISNNQSPDALNFDPSEPHGAVKRQGFSRWTVEDPPAGHGGTFVSGLYGSTFTSGDRHILAAVGTRLYNLGDGSVTDWTDATPDLLSGTAITADEPVRMIMFGDVICIFNPGGGPHKWVGGSGAPVAALEVAGSPPASPSTKIDNAKGAALHKQRLFAWGVPATPSRMYWCAAGVPTDWSTEDNAGSEDIFIDDGSVINGIQSSGDVLWISKKSANSAGTEGAIYGWFGNTPSTSTIKPIAHFSALSQEAMLNYDGVMIIASEEGVFSLSGRGIALLSRDIQSEYLAIPNKATICLGRYQNQVWMAYPASGSDNNRVLVLDMALGRWSKYSGNGNIKVMANHPDGTLLTGRASGDILVDRQVHGQTDNWDGSDDDGSAINFYWSTPDLSFGDFSKDKVGKLFFVHAKDTGDYNVTMTRYLDGELQTDSVAYSFSVQGTGNIDRVVERMVLPSGDRASKFIRFRLTNNTASQDITLFGWSAFADIMDPTR